MRVEIFIQQGPRVTPTVLENQVGGLRAELIDMGQLPGANARLNSLEEAVAELKEGQAQLRNGQVQNAVSLAEMRAEIRQLIVNLR